MAWTRSSKSETGGGIKLYDIVIDWSNYSYQEQFIDIPLPENYTNYRKLAVTILYATYATDENAYLLNCLLGKGIAEESISNIFTILDTSTITSSTTNINIPMVPGNVCGFVYGTAGQSNINTSRIRGYNYSWGWGHYKLIAFGIK